MHNNNNAFLQKRRNDKLRNQKNGSAQNTHGNTANTANNGSNAREMRDMREMRDVRDVRETHNASNASNACNGNEERTPPPPLITLHGKTRRKDNKSKGELSNFLLDQNVHVNVNCTNPDVPFDEDMYKLDKLSLMNAGARYELLNINQQLLDFDMNLKVKMWERGFMFFF